VADSFFGLQALHQGCAPPADKARHEGLKDLNQGSLLLPLLGALPQMDGQRNANFELLQPARRVQEEQHQWMG